MTHLIASWLNFMNQAYHAAVFRTFRPDPPLEGAPDMRRLTFKTTQRTLEVVTVNRKDHRQLHALQFEKGNEELNTVGLDVPLLPAFPNFMRLLVGVEDDKDDTVGWLQHWLGLDLVAGDTNVPQDASSHLDAEGQCRVIVLFMAGMPGPFIEKVR